MAKDPKIDIIVSNLLNGTKNGSIKWDKTNSIFNSDTEHSMITKSSDGLTTFRMTVRVDSTLTKCDPSGMLVIQNDSLLNGALYVHQSDCKKLPELEITLFKEFVSKLVSGIRKNNDSLLDDIASSVFTKEEIRDTKLTSILGDYNPKEKPVENTYYKKEEPVVVKQQNEKETIKEEEKKEDSSIIKFLKKIGL